MEWNLDQLIQDVERYMNDGQTDEPDTEDDYGLRCFVDALPSMPFEAATGIAVWCAALAARGDPQAFLTRWQSYLCPMVIGWWVEARSNELRAQVGLPPIP